MIRASVSYAKNHLSALLGQVKGGESIIITDRDRPIAQMIPIDRHRLGPDLEELSRLGLVRLPVGEPMSLREIQANRVETGGSAGVLDALLDERRDGR